MVTVAFSAGATVTVKTIEDSPPCSATSSLCFSVVRVVLGAAGAVVPEVGVEREVEGEVAFGVEGGVDVGAGVDPEGEGFDPDGGALVVVGAGSVPGAGVDAVVGVDVDVGADPDVAVVVVVVGEDVPEGDVPEDDVPEDDVPEDDVPDVVALDDAPAGPLATPPGPKSSISA